MSDAALVPQALQVELAKVLRMTASVCTGATTRLHSFPPAAGSRTAAHLTGEDETGTWYSMVWAPLAAVDHHLRATALLVDVADRDLGFAVVASARAVVEASSRPWYLLGAETREDFLRRRGTLRLNELRHLSGSFQRTGGGDPVTVEHVRERAVAESQGHATNEALHLSRLAADVLSRQDWDDHHGDDWAQGRRLYSELSGVTHAQNVHLHAMSLGAAGFGEPIALGLNLTWAQNVLWATTRAPLYVTHRLVTAHGDRGQMRLWAEAGERVHERAKALSGRIADLRER